MRRVNIWTRSVSGLGLLVHGLAALAESRRHEAGSPAVPWDGAFGMPAARGVRKPTVSRHGEDEMDTSHMPDPISAAPGVRRGARRTGRARGRVGAALLVLACLGASVVVPSAASAHVVPNDCDDAIAAANLLNDAGDYAGALSAFDAIVEECDGKSERLAIQTGRAHALNMMKRYPEALAAADAVLADDDEHLFGLFERAYANEHSGAMDAATADYERIIQLTEKNENVKERATIYAKVADLNYKSGKTAEAETYLAKALELDPANPAFVIMKGDWAVKSGDYASADAAYNQATAMGVSGVEMYQIRAEASLKMVQEKYGTTNAQELRAQMTPQEKALVCGDLNRALALGWKNPQMDMFAALTCQ